LPCVQSHKTIDEFQGKFVAMFGSSYWHEI
jgi:hypothetical protein